jgi:hypothetical protein
MVVGFITTYAQGLQRNFWAPGQKETWHPPPILQIMILKLSPPRCVISKESVQQKWIDKLWFRKQLTTCLFVWTLNYNSWAPGCRPGWPRLSVGLLMQSLPITTKVGSSKPVHGKVYSIQHYAIKFVSDLWQVGGFLWVLQFPPPIKLTATI